ncbi:glycoside hydrolase superfamily [Entophlyctis helioformis]|nr:glycoside hydrolase superfamily [Entophlyctis helioformis]
MAIRGQLRRTLCGILFWTKCTFAFLMALGGLGYLGYMVYDMYKNAPPPLRPVLQPLSIDPLKCVADPSMGRLETPTGRLMVGFHLDWKLQTPLDMSRLIGFVPAVSNAFMRINPELPVPFDYDLLTWHVWQVSLVGGIFELTIEPLYIERITEAILDRFAQSLRDLNAKYGVPILLRYGHEMNGDWTMYGNKPIQYIAGFRLAARLVRQYTNMTAMVWAPNLGITYPFRSPDGISPMPTLANDPDNFRALDTNNDGVHDWRDDPYGPFYPGDEYVDWVGLSLYWYPDANTGYNRIPPAGYFMDNLRGRGPNIATVNADALNDGGLRDFYGRFAEAKNKPLILPETSAPFMPNRPNGDAEPAIKREWWRQIFAASKELPLLKAVAFFEERKDENLDLRDWRLLANPLSRAAFIEDLKAGGKQFVFGNELKTTCAGQITYA